MTKTEFDKAWNYHLYEPKPYDSELPAFPYETHEPSDKLAFDGVAVAVAISLMFWVFLIVACLAVR